MALAISSTERRVTSITGHFCRVNKRRASATSPRISSGSIYSVSLSSFSVNKPIAPNGLQALGAVGQADNQRAVRFQ